MGRRFEQIRAAIDRAANTAIRAAFKPRFFITRSERYVAGGASRVFKFCTAPEDATDAELRRVFVAADEPDSEEMTVWFSSPLKDKGSAAGTCIAMLTRRARGSAVEIRRFERR